MEFPFYKADDENSIIYTPGGNKKDGMLAVKYCTLPKLIEKITQTVVFDTYFASAFFLTYRDFTTPLELMNFLISRYQGPPPEGIKDHLRLFEIEVDVVQTNVINVIKQLIGTLTAKDFENSQLCETITQFFNSVSEDIKNELFMFYFRARKAAKPPQPKTQPPTSNIPTSAASTMRFSFSVSPRTQSPNSTNVLSDSLTSTTSNNNSSSITARSSIKMPKGLMSKILQSNPSNNSLNSMMMNGSNSTNLSAALNGNGSSGSAGSSTGSLNGGINTGGGSSSGSLNGGGEDDLSANATPTEKPSFVPETIARELTIMEWELITAITVSEFSQKAWTKENQAINIQNLITWFNRISSWVSTKIISKETPEERATIIEAFINIANFAKELKNFNCVMEILGSLHSSSISRLKNSWSLLSPKANDMFTNLNQLMCPDINFKNYRKQLSLCPANEPCIPYLGLFLTDYTYLDESNPPLIKQMVNIERIYLIGSRMQSFFQLFTNCNYQFTSNQTVRDAILGEKVWDENEIFRLSRIREESSQPDSSHGSGKDSGKDSSGGSSKDSSSQGSVVSSSSKRKHFVTKYRMSFTGNDPPPSISSSLSERDWKILTTNAKVIKFKKEKKILSVGETNNNLYRVLNGRVRFESPIANGASSNSLSTSGGGAVSGSQADLKLSSSQQQSQQQQQLKLSTDSTNSNHNQQQNTIQYVECGEIFGEESFLYDRPMMTNIISDSDDCELIEIERSFILQLFASEPILAATFYKHIAILMAERLKTIYINYSNTPLNSHSPLGSSTTISPSSSEQQQQTTLSKRKSTIIDQSSIDVLRNGNDNRFRSVFGLSTEEIIIKSYNCKNNNISGMLYITKHHICFEGKFLGIHKQKMTPFDNILKILPDKNVLLISTKDKIKKFSFKSHEDVTEVYGIVARIWTNHHNTKISKPINPPSVSAATTPPNPPRSPKVGRGESFSSISDLPTKDEWNTILKGAKASVYKKGEVLIQEGSEYLKIFQIIRGECAIVKSNCAELPSSGLSTPTSSSTATTPDLKNSLILSKLSKGSIFGEMNFLIPGGSCASVIVTSDEVEVYTLESYFLHIILKSKSNLAPKFYKYLACVLESRVKQYHQQQQHQQLQSI
eukprot:gene3803-4732_t